jgi:hypothetical protein
VTAGWDEKAQRAFSHLFRGLRQVIETVHHALDDVFAIKAGRARTPWGLIARIGAKVAAHDLAVCLNTLFTQPTFAHFDPFL